MTLLESGLKDFGKTAWFKTCRYIERYMGRFLFCRVLFIDSEYVLFAHRDYTAVICEGARRNVVKGLAGRIDSSNG